VESGLSTSSKGRGKAKEKDHKGAPKVIGDRPLQSGEERDPFSLPSIYMARFTNIIESQGSILLVAQSLDLSIVQALKAPSGHGHNYYIRQGLEASYQRLSARTRLGLVSSARPFCLARLRPMNSSERGGRPADGDRQRSASTRRSHYFDSFYAIMNSTELSRFQRNLSFWS